MGLSLVRDTDKGKEFLRDGWGVRDAQRAGNAGCNLRRIRV